MKIILARHGNTFHPSTPAVYVGITQDISLVEEGKNQAERLGDFLKKNNIIPENIYVSCLKRTQEYGIIIQKKLSLLKKNRIDSRLNEIDYGLWAGLTQEQVKEKFGLDTVLDWSKKNKWPLNADWKPSPEIILTEIHSFLQDIITHHSPESTVLCITSQGRLGYFLQLIPEEWKKKLSSNSIRMKTGSFSEIQWDNNNFRCISWNHSPE